MLQHWHGLEMATSPFSDGSPVASQWPIPPEHFFDYEVFVPVGQAGTYFYHSHVGKLLAWKNDFLGKMSSSFP